jgi:hypothetical protein
MQRLSRPQHAVDVNDSDDSSTLDMIGLRARGVLSENEFITLSADFIFHTLLIEFHPKSRRYAVVVRIYQRVAPASRVLRLAVTGVPSLVGSLVLGTVLGMTPFPSGVAFIFFEPLNDVGCS